MQDFSHQVGLEVFLETVLNILSEKHASTKDTGTRLVAHLMASQAAGDIFSRAVNLGQDAYTVVFEETMHTMRNLVGELKTKPPGSLR